MTTISNEVAKVAKAFAAGIATTIGTVETILSVQPVDHQGVQFITQLQWGIVILAVLATYGITWRVPNRAGTLPGEVEADPTVQPAPPVVSNPGPAHKGQ